MTPTEIARVNQRALARLQDVIDTTCPRGRPGSLPMMLNGATERCIRHFHLMNDFTGAWTDLVSGDAEPHHEADLVGLVVFMADMDDEPDARERAAIALRDFLDVLPEPAPNPMRAHVERHEVERLPPKVRPVRSLRRS